MEGCPERLETEVPFRPWDSFLPTAFGYLTWRGGNLYYHTRARPPSSTRLEMPGYCGVIAGAVLVRYNKVAVVTALGLLSLDLTSKKVTGPYHPCCIAYWQIEMVDNDRFLLLDESTVRLFRVGDFSMVTSFQMIKPLGHRRFRMGVSPTGHIAILATNFSIAVPDVVRIYHVDQIPICANCVSEEVCNKNSEVFISGPFFAFEKKNSQADSVLARFVSSWGFRPLVCEYPNVETIFRVGRAVLTIGMTGVPELHSLDSPRSAVCAPLPYNFSVFSSHSIVYHDEYADGVFTVKISSPCLDLGPEYSVADWVPTPKAMLERDRVSLSRSAFRVVFWRRLRLYTPSIPGPFNGPPFPRSVLLHVESML